jgi:ubiquinone/menaquinone biosynthesis C-methylase UbiE
MIRTPNTQALEKADVAQHFSSISSIYNQQNYLQAGKRGKYPDIAIRHQYFLELLEGTSGRVLEVGCGSGQMLHDLLQRSYEVVGVDLSPGMIAASRKLLSECLPHASVQLMVGDIESLCFPSASFDVVLAAGVIEYLGADERALRELSRVLKPGGTVLLSVRNKLNLSRWLITSRDILQATPGIGKGIELVSHVVRSLIPLPPNGGIPGRRHIPWQLKRALRGVGLQPTDFSFYHFAVFPRFLEQKYGDFCVSWEVQCEIFRRSLLGYFANQYIVKAVKATEVL